MAFEPRRNCENKQLKSLVIRAPFEVDIGNIVQIARAEAEKIFRNPLKIQVVDIIRRDYGWVVVVQNTKSVVQPSEVVSGLSLIHI